MFFKTGISFTYFPPKTFTGFESAGKILNFVAFYASPLIITTLFFKEECDVKGIEFTLILKQFNWVYLSGRAFDSTENFSYSRMVRLTESGFFEDG